MRVVKLYKKGESAKLSDHFQTTEFDCRCHRPECTYTAIDDRLIVALESLRKLTGPITINCGYRCRPHNEEVGGAKDSQHMKGDAADIVTSLSPEATREKCEMISGFQDGGVGSYASFSHVDVRGHRARW